MSIHPTEAVHLQVPTARGCGREGGAAAARPTRSVALVGTYPPTACGIATFTSHLRAAIDGPEVGWRAAVVRLLDEPEPERSSEVIACWLRGDNRSLQHVLHQLDLFDAVLLQHEYGLFGGEDGADVLDLTAGVAVPLITVLHTVLRHPSAGQRRILDGLLEASALVIVQSRAARAQILEVHDADPALVAVVPHGAAENVTGPVACGVSGPIVLTWGLLSPGKGIEHGIEALAALGTRLPAASYIVAGQTHPKERAQRGEQYRQSLQTTARRLGVASRVHLADGYRDWESLGALVRSADAVLLPYDSVDQVSSGVLVEAIASGKPVVATRFPHAAELLRGGVGLLVPHGDAGAMAGALGRVLYEPGVAERLGEAARRASVALLWPAVADAYRALIGQVIDARVMT